jgi:predicted GNAT superfamily acetyltransferase
MEIILRPATSADYNVIHAINEDAAPAVSNITMDELRVLAEMCCDFTVVIAEGHLAGFMMAMQQGQPYESINYRWFSDRCQEFVYVDRLAVSPAFKGRGIGRALYANIESFARWVAPVLTCEVNVIPRNEDSLTFHAKLGFVEVGQQDTEGGKKRVSLMSKTLSR